MRIWLAMFGLKVHVLHGKSFHVFRAPVLIPPILLSSRSRSRASSSTPDLPSRSRDPDGPRSGLPSLLSGPHAGQHLTADRLQQRLKRYGIERSREGRHAALLEPAARLPAPILAERIGIDQARAAAWGRMAGATYADYIALRLAD
jgi:hypothetical protein